MILPAVLCVSAACLQAAGAAAPRRGPKVTEKVGADAAACVNPTPSGEAQSKRTATCTYVAIESEMDGCFGRLHLKNFTHRFFQNTLDPLYPSLPPARTHARSAAHVSILARQRVCSRPFTRRCTHTKGIPFIP